MDQDLSLEEIIELANTKLGLGERLIKDLCRIEHVEGVKKVIRKIKNEQVTLRKKVTDKTITLNNIACSNLLHFESLVRLLLSCKGLVNVDYALPLEDRNGPLRVDAVCDHGATWIKVIARNIRSIEDAVHGRTSYGVKSILDQAEEYAEAAQCNLHLFKPPEIFFVFNCIIGKELRESLDEVGVNVTSLDEFCGNDCEIDLTKPVDDDLRQQQLEGVTTLNLDITTLLAYVSALTNPQPENVGFYWEFKFPLLTEQSRWEVSSPVKPLLDSIFAGRRLICCETAKKSFEDIIELLGGPNETTRAKELLATVEVLPDVEISHGLAELKVGGRIKERSLKIFAFGLEHQAVTVTSNEGFIRAARMQGIDIPVFVHEARALTEEKEKTGKRIAV